MLIFILTINLNEIKIQTILVVFWLTKLIPYFYETKNDGDDSPKDVYIYTHSWNIYVHSVSVNYVPKCKKIAACVM